MKSLIAFIVVLLSFPIHAFAAPPIPQQKPAFMAVLNAKESTIRQMIGQMLIVGFKGKRIKDAGAKRLAEHLKAGTAGGVLFLGPNVSARVGDVQALTHLFHEAGSQAPSGLIPLLTIDQEGGRIQRLRDWHDITEMPSAADVAKVYSPDQAQRLYKQVACRLKQLGFNVNFGPVVDLAIEPKNPIITRLGRAYAKDAPKVTAFAKAFVAGHRACGVMTSLKHYPGHGSSIKDSHKGLTDITRTWHDSEQDPYRSLINTASIDSVMVGHLMHQKVDPLYPSSLSQAWVDGQLRHGLGYGGLVITDDLDMGAIHQHFSTQEAVLRAILAGADLLILSNSRARDPDLPATISRFISAEIAKPNAQLTVERIEQSYLRIKAAKQKLSKR